MTSVGKLGMSTDDKLTIIESGGIIGLFGT